jgi:hypothetical protein
MRDLKLGEVTLIDPAGLDQFDEPLKSAVEELLRHSSAEQRFRREVIKMVRPDWQALGVTVLELARAALTAVGVDASICDPGRMPTVYPVDAVRVHDGSPAAADCATNLHPGVNPENGRVFKIIAAQLMTGVEHLCGLAILLSASGPARPLFAAARTILLSGVRLTWLSRPELDASKRAIRAVNFDLRHLSEMAGDLRVGGDNGFSDKAAELERERQQILQLARLDGFSVDKGGNYLVPVESRDSAMAAEAAPGLGPAAWREFSSSAHCMDRGAFAAFALDQVVALDDDRTRRAYAAGAVHRAVVLAYQGLEHAANYLGGDTGVLQETLGTLHDTWNRASMSSEGEKINEEVADALIETWT